MPFGVGLLSFVEEKLPDGFFVVCSQCDFDIVTGIAFAKFIHSKSGFADTNGDGYLLSGNIAAQFSELATIFGKRIHVDRLLPG